jgi:hypothetical protein
MKNSISTYILFSFMLFTQHLFIKESRHACRSKEDIQINPCDL